MRIFMLFIVTALFFGCEKNNPTPMNEPAPTTTGSQNNNHLGVIQFDIEVVGTGTVTHYEYYIDSVKQGTILVDNGQGGSEYVMYYVGSNTKSIGFRYFDSNGDENVLSLTESINGTTNSVSISHLGATPYVAQTNTSVPLCNTADFEIDVISDKEATFSADYLYNFYTSEEVHLTNGSYVMY